ncbi:hypothetical protein [Bartonella sp. CL32QHWL-1]|uniref:hypothetical protein n=1 Tax=Bartonella sp. CL32QHWL-1 TaxID=3243524 RepID=UPI0035D04F4D
MAIYQNKHLTEQLEQKKQECAEHKDIIAQGEQKCLQLTDQLEQKEQDCVGYQDIIAQGEQKCLQLTDQLEQKEQDCAGHQDIIAQGEQKCLHLTDQLEKKKQECAEHKDIIAQGEQKCLQLTDQLEQKEQDCAGHQDIIAQGEQKCLHLTDQLEKKKQECAEHKDIIAQGEQKCLQLTDQLEQKEQDCAGHKDIIAQGEQKCLQLTDQLERKEQECVGYQDIIAQGEQKCLQLTDQLERKEQECAGYQDIIAQGEQRLVKKTQKVSQEWLKQWDEGVRLWERDVLGIKNPREDMKVGGDRLPFVKDICVRGEHEVRLLYKQALEKKLTYEHYKKICSLLDTSYFRKFFVKAVRLMRKNGITLQKFVDPLTNKKRSQPTMLLLHWWLYVLDDMITAECKQHQKENSTGEDKKKKFTDTLWDNISISTEHEEIEEMLKLSESWSGECILLLYCKKKVLLLLCDFSSDYKAARETFIYYKKLIKTVKKGYVAFDNGCHSVTVRDVINTCKENDTNRAKDLSIAEGNPTFEKVYKLGAREWIKAANETCDNRLIFWEKLVEEKKLKEKLKIIFGNEKIKALKEVVEKDKEQLASEMQKAILENKDFCYYKSREYFIDYLR